MSILVLLSSLLLGQPEQMRLIKITIETGFKSEMLESLRLPAVFQSEKELYTFASPQTVDQLKQYQISYSIVGDAASKDDYYIVVPPKHNRMKGVSSYNATTIAESGGSLLTKIDPTTVTTMRNDGFIVHAASDIHRTYKNER